MCYISAREKRWVCVLPALQRGLRNVVFRVDRNGVEAAAELTFVAGRNNSLSSVGSFSSWVPLRYLLLRFPWDLNSTLRGWSCLSPNWAS